MSYFFPVYPAQKRSNYQWQVEAPVADQRPKVGHDIADKKKHRERKENGEDDKRLRLSIPLPSSEKEKQQKQKLVQQQFNIHG